MKKPTDTQMLDYLNDNSTDIIWDWRNAEYIILDVDGKWFRQKDIRRGIYKAMINSKKHYAHK